MVIKHILSTIRPTMLAAVVCIPVCGSAATPEANTMTGIFDEACRTLTVETDGQKLAPPVIGLLTNDRLTIGFDMLSEERDYLRYSIYHCDADWHLSDVTDTEVFDGFNYADVTDYAFSRGTSVHYVHYTITLPNEEFQFKLSGNYLLRVYQENDPDELILQVRFMVSEGAVTIGGEVTSRTDEDYNDRHQQLNLSVNLNGYPVRDIFNDIKLVVSQNNRVDNPVMVTHPSRVAGQTAIYEHLRPLIFPAGNEYRRMETVQITYPGMGVEDIDYHAPYYHHVLSTAGPRHSRPYSFDSTQQGRFLVREYNSTQPDTEADYTVVHFTLRMLPLLDADVYVDGDLTYRHFDDTSRMKYDEETGVYHTAMLLKQGAYNYQYLALPHTTTASGKPVFANMVQGVARTADVEGDFHQTVNEYQVAVYYRAPGERYDRLLGYTLLYSGR